MSCGSVIERILLPPSGAQLQLPKSAVVSNKLCPLIEKVMLPGSSLQVDASHSKSSCVTTGPVCVMLSPQRSITQLAQPSFALPFASSH
jgi:hypothetical protein